MSGSMRAFVGLCASLCVLILSGKPALAIGEEYELRGDDLIVVVDTRWAGNSQGGYYPVRIRLTNRGEDRMLTFRFAPNESLPVVEQTVQADQNATLQFTLSVPMVGHGAYGAVQIFSNGRELGSLTRNISLASVEQNTFERPALLVVSPTNVNCDYFEQAVDALRIQLSGGAGAGWGYGSLRAADHVVLPPASLPNQWIDYSGLDIVAVALDTLIGLDRERREAILSWTDCGGTLLVFDVGEPVTDSQRLAKVLQIDASDTSEEWTLSNPSRRQNVPQVELDAYGNPIATNPTVVTPNQALAQALKESAANKSQGEAPATAAWAAEPGTFAWHRKMLGVVYAFPEDPFPGTIHDWNWLLRAMGATRLQWTQRHGLSARLPQTHSEFISFLIPGVRGVPVYAFLVLMTVFTIVIGPLNYLFLLRRRRLHLLLVTIPLCALFTTVSLFGYSIMAHGFSVKSRTRSLTMLDQQNKTAVTINRLALYAGLAPADGLRFSPDTAVYPMQAPGSSFESGRVDWSEAQALSSGWLKSRTRSQFTTVSHRIARGRLTVEPAQNERLSVANGLEWDLEALIVSDDAGDLFFGADIAAGAGTKLAPIGPSDLDLFIELLGRHPLVPPPGASLEPNTFFDVGAGGRYPFDGGGPPAKFASNSMELELKRLQTLDRTNQLRSNSYAAILKRNPDVETGVESVDEQAGYHVLIGYY